MFKAPRILTSAFTALALTFALSNTHGAPEGQYALSRFNNPKYPEGFTHFAYVNPNAPKGGRLRIATIGTFDSCNREIVKGVAAEGLAMTADPLMKRSPDDPYTWYALIAQRALVAPDSSQVTFFLNPRAKFHDGTPITAEDVKFSIEILRDQGLPRYKKFYSQIEKIEVLDPQTVRLTFRKDPQKGYDTELPMIMGNLRPLSRKSLEGKDLMNSGLTILLGSGPYKVAKAEQGRKIVYERVKDYWAADLPVNKGQNNFDEISIEYFKNDQTLREAFKAGEIDTYFETNHRKWFTDYTFPAAKRGDVVQFEIEHKRPVTVWTPIFNMKKDIFQDRRVRKAIAMVFDFNHANKSQFQGALKRMDSLFANTLFVPKGNPSSAELEILAPYKNQLDPEVYADSINLYDMKTPQDKRRVFQEAGKLLDEAGWVIEKGIRVHKDTKKPLHFIFLLKNQQLDGVVLAFKDALKTLGVEMEVRRVDVTQYEKAAVDKTFDMILHAWANSLSPGIEQSYYFSPEAADQPGSSNYIGCKDPALYALAQLLSNPTSYEDLVIKVKAFDRAVMGMYYMIPGIYENHIRFAYWKNRLAFPPITPEVGTNAPEWWWAIPQGKSHENSTLPA